MARHTLLPALLAILVGASPAHAWTWPADGPVLQRFTLGDNPYVAGLHRGIDVAGLAGTPVRAPAAGTVSFAGTVPHHGRTVTIRTPDGYAVTLVHLGGVAVSRSSPVAEGAVVGTIGPTGDAEHSIPYVHLGVRVAAEPEGYVDPLLVLPPRELPPGASPREDGATSDQGVVEPVAAGTAGAEATTGDAEAPGAEVAADARGGSEMTAGRPAEAEIPLPEAAETVTSGAGEASAETAVATEQADGTATAVSAEETAADTRTVPAEATADERATEVPRAGAAEQAPAAAEAAGDRAAQAAGEAAVEAPSNPGARAAVAETPSESSGDPANETPSPVGFDAPAGGGANTAANTAPAEAAGELGSKLAGDHGAAEATGGVLSDNRAHVETGLPAPQPAEAPVPRPPSSPGGVAPATEARGAATTEASPPRARSVPAPATSEAPVGRAAGARSDVSGASAAIGGPLRAAARGASIGPPSGAADGERGEATPGAPPRQGRPTTRTEASRNAVGGTKSSTVRVDERAVGEPSADEPGAGTRDRHGDAEAGRATRSIAFGVLILAVVLLAALAFLGMSGALARRRSRVPVPPRAANVRRQHDRLRAPVSGSEAPLDSRGRLAFAGVEVGTVEHQDGRVGGTPDARFDTWKTGTPHIESLDRPAGRDGDVRTRPRGSHGACLRGGDRSTGEADTACVNQGPRGGAVCRRSSDVTVGCSARPAPACTGGAGRRPRRVLDLTRLTSGRHGLAARGRRAAGRLDAGRARTRRGAERTPS